MPEAVPVSQLRRPSVRRDVWSAKGRSHVQAVLLVVRGHPSDGNGASTLLKKVCFSSEKIFLHFETLRLKRQLATSEARRLRNSTYGGALRGVLQQAAGQDSKRNLQLGAGTQFLQWRPKELSASRP